MSLMLLFASSPPSSASGVDTGSFAETATVAVTVTGTDTGSATEGQASQVAPTPMSSADTGTSVEAGSIRVGPVTDTGTFTESGTVQLTGMSVAGADTGASTDTQSVTAKPTGGDGGALVETEWRGVVTEAPTPTGSALGRPHVPRQPAVVRVRTGVYRYIVADMLTGTPIEELSLDCDQFSQNIMSTGQCTAKLALPVPFDWRAATVERRTTLNIIRDDTRVVWGGPIIKRHPVNNGTAAELTAETWEGYLARRRIKVDVPYSNTDVLDIARGILDRIQEVPGGDIGMTYDTVKAGYAKSLSYFAKDRVKVLDELNRLAEIAPFFEFYVEVRRLEDGRFRPHMRFARPGFGIDLPPITAEYPGNVTSYDYPEDGGRAANAVTGIGGNVPAVPPATEETKLMVEVVDLGGEIARGFPIYEDELSLTDERDMSILTSRTEVDLTSRLVDYVIPTVDIRGAADPVFGSYPLGIRCRLRASSAYHPALPDGTPGLDITRRVQGWTVKPTASGRQEIVTLALTGVTGKFTPPLDRVAFQKWLAQVETRLRRLDIR